MCLAQSYNKTHKHKKMEYHFHEKNQPQTQIRYVINCLKNALANSI